ncbi:hypothetical protein DYI37_11425 [Fulvimarina endophytica]|uniref:Mu-like prophage FluMu N-terminal domain-containing protein n=1 Tax=Fulvimarina endophytica TaxID=2293836 RepID=A0A371X320_9HYPH|nr:hypothetical protein [Fulvimarina endophytica]RFC63609.1 hypothetical protein DYI37_11425 [Fulvimarina endophytica]
MQDIQIICRAPGMRRCGIAHPESAVYRAGRWSETELERFRADPMFEVREASPHGLSMAAGASEANAGPRPVPLVGIDPTGASVGRIEFSSAPSGAVLSYAGAELYRRGGPDEPDFMEIDVTTQIDIVIVKADGEPVSAATLATVDLAPAAGIEASVSVAPGASASDEVLQNGAGPTEPTQDAVPATDVDRPAKIAAAVGALSDDEMTQAGRPKLAVLETKLGFRPNADEVDAALKTLRR